jgi:hypothetical protein
MILLIFILINITQEVFKILKEFNILQIKNLVIFKTKKKTNNYLIQIQFIK